MKIDPSKIAGVSQAKRADKSRKAGSTAFGDMLSEETQETGAPAQAAPTRGMESVIAAQEVDDREANSRRAKERAEEMLEKLESIRTGLLLGGIPIDQLRRLSTIARQGRDSFTDPRMAEILDDIELRARVELAKYDPSA
jgi:hypothetical protein